MQTNLVRPLMTLLLVVATLLTSVPVQAQSTDSGRPDSAPLSIQAEQDGLLLSWDGGEIAAAGLEQLATVRYGSYDLPMRLVTVTGSGDLTPVVQTLSAAEWPGALQPAAQLVPPALDFASDPFMLAPAEPIVLPQAPVFVYSKGRQRGQEIRVIAISPIFQEDGVLKLAGKFTARVHGAQLVDGAATRPTAADVQAAGVRPQIGAETELAPTNIDATTTAVKLVVTHRGIQEVTYAMLHAVGFEVNNLARLSLSYKGQPVPIEILGDGDNKLDDPSDAIRFYALAEGDYWSNQEIYWLSLRPGGGARMASRTVEPLTAPTRTTAVESGVWKNNTKYVSQQPGFDKDHWFALDMKADPGMTAAEWPTLTATLDAKLPLVSGQQAQLTPNLTTYIKGLYTLRAKLGNVTIVPLELNTTANASPASAWQPNLQFGAPAKTLELKLEPKTSLLGLLVDSIAWSLPVSLNFNRRGAVFSGITGSWRYTMAGTPAGYALYDITDPYTPLRLTGVNSQHVFEDGPDVHHYLVTGDGTLHNPQVQPHDPMTFSAADGADALYLAPTAYIDALAPLVRHREEQGYQVKVVDVQAIYDAWGYGHVSPEAIRSFLRFAVANWSPSPISVVLVSDGTRDPLNYEQRESTINFIPPYLRTSFLDQNGFERFVDPWLGQNGCDNCYAQLDGDDPLNNEFETPGKGFLPDIWLGRIPAKSAGEVSDVVNKIITYETTQTPPPYWRRTAAFLADDYTRPDGTIDSAGDFIQYSEDIIRLMPGGMRPARVYYDPTYQGTEPWRETDATQVRLRSIALAGSGPAILTYNGHANHWQWAGTALNVDNPYIFGLYDVDLLQNRNQYFIGLSMTCYTSQFFQPSNAGTTLDERMLMFPTAGAAAVWGPSGLSVLHGHDDLQYGFHTRLWSMSPGTARMGELVEAGYLENFAPSAAREKPYACCEDVRRTFVLLGDPLTTVQAMPGNDVYLPLVAKR